jgi:hypothetical protein
MEALVSHVNSIRKALKIETFRNPKFWDLGSENPLGATGSPVPS